MHTQRLAAVFLILFLLSGCNYPTREDHITPSATLVDTPQLAGGSPSTSIVEVPLHELCEPNEGHSTAPQVGDGTFQLEITSNEVDWFMVSVAAGSTLVVRIEFSHSQGDLDLELYDVQNSLLNQSRGTSNVEEISYTIPTQGTVYIRVLGYHAATGEYTLTITGSDPQSAPSSPFCQDTQDPTSEPDPLGSLAYRLEFDSTGPGFTSEILDPSANSANVFVDPLWEYGYDSWLPPSDQFAMVTVLDNYYPNNANGSIMVGPFDFSQVNSARLEFKLVYEIEMDYDGLIIAVTTDMGVSWDILTPDSGYPGNAYIIGGPAFTGYVPWWQEVSVDLSTHLSPNTAFAIHFRSDPSIENWGAGVDEITVWINGPTSSSGLGPVQSYIPPISPGDLPPLNPNLFPKTPRFIPQSLLNCREGNHTGFDIVTMVKPQTSLSVKAMNPEGTWFYVLDPESRELCWVWHEGGRVEGEAHALAELPNQIPPTESAPEDSDRGKTDYCLHTETLAIPPQCVPCFEGANPGTSCTP